MPLSAYLNLEFIILDMPEDVKVPLILERPFFSTAYTKIDVFKRKITLRVGDEKIIFKSVKPASSLIKRVYMRSLRERMELDLEARLMGETLVLNRSLDPLYGDYIELNDLNVPLELRRDQVYDLMPTIEEGKVIEEFRARNDARMVSKFFGYPSDYDYDKKIRISCPYNMKFSCMICFEFLHANFFLILYVNVMSKKFHNSIMKDKLEYKGNNVVGALMNIHIFVGTFYVLTDFAVLEDMDAYRDEGMGDNRVLIVKPHNKTPYELFRGFKPAIGFMKPFGCHVTILNTLDKLGKFNGKSDEGFFVGYSLSSKAYRVYNTRTRKVQENLHVRFLENKPMIEGNGPKWLFDIDSLTQSMNYVPVVAGTFSNNFAGSQGVFDASSSSQQNVDHQDCLVMPIWKDAPYFDLHSQNTSDAAPKFVADGSHDENVDTEKSNDDSSLKNDRTTDQQVNTASPDVNTGSIKVSTALPEVNTSTPQDLMGPSHSYEDIQEGSFNIQDDQQVDLGNIPNSYEVPTTPSTRIHKDHQINDVIRKTHQDLHTCLFACFLSQKEPKKISKALSDPAWVEAMQRNKKDKRGIVIKNKARLVDQGHTQGDGIDYDEFFAPVARIEAIRLFLAYASYMGFMVYQMDVKSAFLYGQIEEEHYMDSQAPRAWYETLANYLLSNGFQRGKIDQTLFIKRHKGHILLVQIYVDDIIFGSTLKELCDKFEKLMQDKFQMSSTGEVTFFLGLQIQHNKKDIFISQDKYVNEILRKFNYTDVKSASTLVDLEKPLVQDGDATDVDEHLYRSMIGSLMYLTTSRPDIMFAVCACARFQVSPKTYHLLAVKRIFRYLKGKPTLGLWYSKDSPLELVAYTNSDYARATQDRKSTTGGCLLTKGFDAGRFQYLVSNVYTSFIKQFWTTAETSIDSNGVTTIIAMIDDHSKTITKASLCRHLKLDDYDGIYPLPNSEIFEQLALMGYHTDSDKLTFQKGAFSPQWRFLIHTVLHCLSPKKIA
ncbi:putative ribonuclease H-like domain-containing protein [Tanacetum coccineum]